MNVDGSLRTGRGHGKIKILGINRKSHSAVKDARGTPSRLMPAKARMIFCALAEIFIISINIGTNRVIRKPLAKLKKKAGATQP